MTATVLPLSQIIVPPERQRQEFDPPALLELATSISTHGLFHALQVRSDGRTLVTGERRFRAIRDHLAPLQRGFLYAGQPVPPGHVPVIPCSSEDPLAIEEIELEENTHRRDLTWQEQAAATARLAAIKAARTGEVPPVAALAEAVRGASVGRAYTDTRLEVLVAPHLSRPEVAAAPTLKDAFKTIQRLEDAERNRELARVVGATHHAGVHTVLQGNCLEWMSDPANAGTVDVICTDPPYGMGAHEFGDGAGRLSGIEHTYDDSPEAWHQLMSPAGNAWCELAYRVAKPEAHAYIFCDLDRFHPLREYMRDAGWYVLRTPLINVKTNSGRVPLPDIGPRRQYEILLYAIKGKKHTRFLASDVIESLADEQLSHGAQKPVSLFHELLRRSVLPGDTVLDAFAGTGTILPAAHSLQCRAIAIELNPTYYGLCLRRLDALPPAP